MPSLGPIGHVCAGPLGHYIVEHHHSGIAMLTPAQVHYGQAEEVLAQRQRVLDAACAAHPERFVNGPPKVPSRPQAVWINPPEDKSRSEIKLHETREMGVSKSLTRIAIPLPHQLG